MPLYDVYPVGNISFGASEDNVRELLAEVGEVLDIKYACKALLRYALTCICRLVAHTGGEGTHRGFGFATYTDEATAQAAIRNLNGRDLMGRNIIVANTTPGSAGTKQKQGMGGRPVRARSKALLRLKLCTGWCSDRRGAGSSFSRHQ